MSHQGYLNQNYRNLILLSTLILFQGCDTMCRGLGGMFPGQCKKDSPGHHEPEPEPAVTTNTVTQPSHTTVTPTRKKQDIVEYVTGEGYPLTLMTPEQLANHIRIALGHDGFTFYEPSIAREIDFLQILYGVSLGGIDFVNTSKRDRSIKAQTLLVARAIAWQIARDSVFLDIQRSNNSQAKTLLVHVNHYDDRPFMDTDLGLSSENQALVREGEARWKLQVEEFYWRFYSRPPNSQEVLAIREAFISSVESEANVAGAWVMVLYAMSSSQEFWNL